MGLYVPCPSCPKYRPGFERGLVLKGDRYCRMCRPYAKRNRRRNVKRRKKLA